MTTHSQITLVIPEKDGTELVTTLFKNGFQILVKWCRRRRTNVCMIPVNDVDLLYQQNCVIVTGALLLTLTEFFIFIFYFFLYILSRWRCFSTALKQDNQATILQGSSI